MSSDDFEWQPGVLMSTEDQAVVHAYEAVGVPLDALAYTEEFKRLVAEAGEDPTRDVALRRVYRKLLALRKRGLLPRLYRVPGVSED